MSEERNIRINKVLRELNISLERAVDYLKDKGIAIDANPNAKISDKEFDILQNQFAGDKGNKEASKGVSEEIKKEKEALRLEREKEIEDKRKQEEERHRLEVIKAKAVVSGPKQVGKIDLEPKQVPTNKPESVKSEAKVEEKPAPIKEKLVQSKEKPAVAEEKPSQKEVVVEAKVEEVKVDKIVDNLPVEDETHTTQYQNLSGPTLTGQKIDLSQFNKPKKTTPPKINSANKVDPNKNKRKRIPPKPGEARPGTPGGNAAGGQNRPAGAGGNKFTANKPGGGGFQKGNRPAIVQKVEPTEEEVKNQIKETLERLQGKGSKSKAAKYRRDKRDTHRQRSDDEQRALDEGSKTIKSNRICYCW
jgi:translation initiation factor IF-2